MHVLHVIPHLGLGGSEKLAYELAKLQRAKGLEVSVAVLSKPTVDNGMRMASERADVLADLGVTVRQVAQGSRAAFTAARSLRASAWPQPVTMVHAHLVVGAAAAFMGMSGRPPIVLTLHNTEFGFPRAGLRLTQPFVSRYVGCSASVSSALQPRLGVPIYTVTNGIELGEYLAASTSRAAGPDGGFRMISVGALRPAKNFPRLIQATIQARAQLRDKGTELTLDIVGDGELRGALEALISEAGAEEYIKLLGTRTDIPDLLSRADAFALGSDHEGLPLALIEAMAAGLPSVVSPFEGASNISQDGRTSLIAADLTVAGLASAIVQLASDPELRSRLASASMAEAPRYSIERCAQEYERHYELAASSRRQR